MPQGEQAGEGQGRKTTTSWSITFKTCESLCRTFENYISTIPQLKKKLNNDEKEKDPANKQKWQPVPLLSD